MLAAVMDHPALCKNLGFSDHAHDCFCTRCKAKRAALKTEDGLRDGKQYSLSLSKFISYRFFFSPCSTNRRGAAGPRVSISERRRRRKGGDLCGARGEVHGVLKASILRSGPDGSSRPNAQRSSRYVSIHSRQIGSVLSPAHGIRRSSYGTRCPVRVRWEPHCLRLVG